MEYPLDTAKKQLIAMIFQRIFQNMKVPQPFDIPRDILEYGVQAKLYRI